MKSLILIFSMLVWVYSHAETQTETTVIPLKLTDKNTKGSELRGQAGALFELVKAKKFVEAEQLATQLRHAYEVQFNKHLKQYTFQSENEYAEFKRTSSDQFEWIDWGYKECLQMLAFIKSEKRDFHGAIENLREIEQLAPTSATSLIESGYILNKLGMYNEALSTYLDALELSTKYATQQPFQAASLRGIGHSFTELNQLNEAETAYQDSLKLDPRNPVALKELKYIQSLRDSNKAKQAP
jgi:tetratricopeptide (TPR) repeat protein